MPFFPESAEAASIPKTPPKIFFPKNGVKKFRALPKQNTEKKKEYLSIL